MLDKKNPSQKAIMTEDMKIAIAGAISGICVAACISRAGF